MFLIKRRILALLAITITLFVTSAFGEETSDFLNFRFGEDSLSYANQVQSAQEEKVTYSLRCFTISNTARKFIYHAEFNPNEPKLEESEYHKLILKVLKSSDRNKTAKEKRISIPGYSNLYEFSQAYEAFIKKHAGGVLKSFFQRGNWRMIFPFSRRGQARAAEKLKNKLQNGDIPIVHLVEFPRLDINHAVLLFNVTETQNEVRFDLYAPNFPDRSRILTFHKTTRQFEFVKEDFFEGGPVNVYEIYKSWMF